MELSIFSIAFDVKDADVKSLPFPTEHDPNKPLIVQFVAMNITDAMNYAKQFEGVIIGVQRLGPCVLCGSLVDFE